VALAALLSAPLAAIPWIAAHADPATGTAVQLAQAAPTTHPAAANPASERPDTVEQRITDLHQALKITPDEEKKWNDVAQAMRDNAANMEKLIAEKRKQAPHDMTAIDDLETYQKFAQAHVDGLKNLTSAFKSLYSSMPDPQKKNADQVFENFHKTPNSGRG
ncbi:MAG TPA: Spy/CpxP family protein refolding chaperone, partial [Stellaceae bacterium]|nr:Spy/CpxP family protein refolding chaperone [Stellaceae bacterium]